MFVQIAEGVDDGTWLHHLHSGDYSRWLSDLVRDDDLAAEVAEIESDQALDPRESRARDQGCDYPALHRANRTRDFLGEHRFPWPVWRQNPKQR